MSLSFKPIVAAVSLALLFLPVQQAAAQSKRPMAAASATAPLSPKQRGQLAHQFVTQWGMYVQRVYNVPAGVWAKRMVPTFAAVDTTNFRNALKRDTFEGAMAELNGTGHRLSDRQAIDRLARLAPSAVGTQSGAVAAKFGDLAQDLVYTPLQPCRIVDTRNTAAGAIAAGGTRSFVALITTNFASQGGSATNCGTSGVGASAVALNVTAVGYTASGHAIVYPFGSTLPDTSSLNFNASNYATNNAIIAKIPNPLASSDFNIWTVQSSHFVVDIVGYFSPPQATNLQCTQTALESHTIAAGASTFYNNQLCPSGYHEVMPYCYTSDAGVNSAGSGVNSNTAGLATFCAWHNTTGGSKTVFGGSICCRVPGR